MNAPTVLPDSWFSVLRDGGFRKKGRTWRRESSDTVFVFNLQRSAFSETYFASAGVVFKSIEHVKDPPVHKCHFYGRIHEPQLDLALDLTQAMTDRSAVVRHFVDTELLPMARACSTEAGAITFFRSQPSTTFFVQPVARVALGLAHASG